MKRKTFAILILLAGAAAAAVGLRVTRDKTLCFESSAGVTLGLPEVVADLSRARFVFVGESHDNRDHHRSQLALVRALHRAGVPLAIGLEMFRSEAQPELDRWVAGTLSRLEFFDLYARNWDIRLWSAYAGIFDYARDEGIPLIGLNVPHEVVSQVDREGFSSLTDEQRRALGTVECNVDPRYQKLLGEVLGVEEQAGPRFLRFCEAQLVWDVAMARRLLAYAERNPGRTAVVLAGTFHAWKHGIPEQIARRSDLPCRVILPAADESVADYAVALQDADYVWRLR
jgi:uncharacterized iron-regulated protein